MPHDDDFQTETAPGLARALPQGERVLWQGRPRTWALAREAMCVRWVLGYFLALALLRGGMIGATDPAAGASAALFYLVLAALAGGIVLAIAAVLARTTVYTITTGRVVMRIGAALTISLNLPLKDIASADLIARPDGSGSIHLALKGGAKISYMVLWPHVRPWMMSQPEPSLRGVADVHAVARTLGDAVQAAGLAAAHVPTPARPVRTSAGAAVPAE